MSSEVVRRERSSDSALSDSREVEGASRLEMIWSTTLYVFVAVSKVAEAGTCLFAASRVNRVAGITKSECYKTDRRNHEYAQEVNHEHRRDGFGRQKGRVPLLRLGPFNNGINRLVVFNAGLDDGKWKWALG